MASQISISNKVRESCSNFQSLLAWCDRAQVEHFASHIDCQEIIDFVHSSEGLSTNRFDQEIQFPSSADEIGFILIAHGLDFGSGFRHLLHQHRQGQGAWLTIRAGLVKLGQQNPSCPSQWLVSLKIDDIIQLFELHHESLNPLAEQLYTSIHEIGQVLFELGYQTPGEFVLKEMTHSAERAVAAIVHHFPLTFCDEYELDICSSPSKAQVCFYKKAQLVVSEMNMLFGRRNPELFAYPDIDCLTAFVDNVVVSMLRMHHVVNCVDSLSEKITQGEYLLKGSEEEVALRSAALTGVELLVQRLKQLRAERQDHGEPINAQKLCNWLWGCEGKKPQNRKYPRHLCPTTSFY